MTYRGDRWPQLLDGKLADLAVGDAATVVVGGTSLDLTVGARYTHEKKTAEANLADNNALCSFFSVAVAPLQLAMGYATLFNGGIYHPPTILKINRDHPLPKGRRVFSARLATTSPAHEILLELRPAGSGVVALNARLDGPALGVGRD